MPGFVAAGASCATASDYATWRHFALPTWNLKRPGRHRLA